MKKLVMRSEGEGGGVSSTAVGVISGIAAAWLAKFAKEKGMEMDHDTAVAVTVTIGGVVVVGLRRALGRVVDAVRGR